MQTLSHDILRTAFPKMAKATRDMILAHAPAAMERFDISNSKRVASFIGQLAHESAGFTARVENLNYGWQALMRVWPKHFPSAGVAKKYERRPSAIASRAYRLRMGNGDEASGDGWKFRGRGFIQLTGKNNYAAFAKAMGMTLDEAVAYLETPAGAFMSAAWYWQTNRLNDLADEWRLRDTSARINGKDPAHGLDDRKAKSNAVLRALEAAA